MSELSGCNKHWIAVAFLFISITVMASSLLNLWIKLHYYRAGCLTTNLKPGPGWPAMAVGGQCSSCTIWSDLPLVSQQEGECILGSGHKRRGFTKCAMHWNCFGRTRPGIHCVKLVYDMMSRLWVSTVLVLLNLSSTWMHLGFPNWSGLVGTAALNLPKTQCALRHRNHRQQQGDTPMDTSSCTHGAIEKDKTIKP